MKKILLLLLASVSVSSCTIGPRMENLNFSRSPRGALVELSSKTRGAMNGELLAVTETGLVVLVGGRVATVSFDEIQQTEFPELNWRMRGAPRRQDLDLLRRISHFPQGITPEIQAQLDARYPG